MKKLITVVVVVLILVVALSFAKDIIAKSAVSAGVRAVTGLKLGMRSMNVGVLNTLINIKELRLFNPDGYEDEIMLNMPEIHVDYNLGAFFKGRIHLEEVRLNMQEFVVVKNENGELNLDSLKVVKAQKDKTASKEAAAMPPMQIDRLRLKIGRVIFKDYSRGAPPKVREFNVNIDEQYENITNPYTFASLIVFKALANTSIAGLTGFDLGALEKGLDDTLKKAARIAEDTSRQAVETGKQAVQQAQEAAEEAAKRAQETAAEAAETIKKLFPFGGSEGQQ